MRCYIRDVFRLQYLQTHSRASNAAHTRCLKGSSRSRGRRILVGSAGACLAGSVNGARFADWSHAHSAHCIPHDCHDCHRSSRKSSRGSHASDSHRPPDLRRSGPLQAHRQAARTAMPDPQLGIRVDAALRLGPSGGTTSTCEAHPARCIENRMSSDPDPSIAPPQPSRVRDRAAFFEYAEGSHEANAGQCNSGRGVARRPG